jgi:hypothetical protein
MFRRMTRLARIVIPGLTPKAVLERDPQPHVRMSDCASRSDILLTRPSNFMDAALYAFRQLGPCGNFR